MARFHLVVDCGTGQEHSVPYTAEEEAAADAAATEPGPAETTPPPVSLSLNEAGGLIIAVEMPDGTTKTGIVPLI